MKTWKLIKLLFISSLVIGCLFSCKKENKQLTTANFYIYNPINGQGMQGVKVSIYEQKDVTQAFKLQNEYETRVIWEGTTDINGTATCSFKTFKNDKYTYWQYVDENTVQTGGKKILSHPEYAPLKKEKINKVECTYTVPASFKLQFKNINCMDVNDRFRVRYQWKYNSSQFGWSNWSPNQLGCYDSDVSSPWNSYNDYFITEYEVERNNITNTYLDTFYIDPYSVDTFKIFY